MKKNVIIAMVAAAMLTGSCVENETSFFIEHAKAQPSAPECTVSASDPVSAFTSLDLALGTEAAVSFLVRNQLVSREDYDNLRLESNGIFVDAADVSLRTDTNESLGSIRTSADGYIEPESSDLARATLILPELGQELQERFNCPAFSRQAYPDSTVYTTGTDANGNEVGRRLGTIQAVVRFLGHTGGRLEVETPTFIYNIDICCGCNIDWFSCHDPFERYCVEPDFSSSTCYPGLGAEGGIGADCRQIYYDPENAAWQCFIEGEDPDDPLIPAICQCSNSE